MNAREAKRRVCHGAAQLLDDGSMNLWLSQGEDGKDLSDADTERMHQAFEDLVSELRRRGGAAVERVGR